MAVPTIPSAIALTDIQTEFGGSNPIAINEYYAGGTYVASGTANATSVSIPTSGQIAFSNFSGAVGIINGLVKAFLVQTFDFGFATAQVQFLVNHNTAYFDTCNISSYQYQTGNVPLLDIRFTKTSGGGTLAPLANNTWYALNVTRTQSLGVSAPVSASLFANVAIKYNANSTIISSNICNWQASAEGTT